ncbi:MAG: hypothetical protein H6745_04175 [Deltaproteobacteria bacterium]|nr:hypothetical protein [Deltaproteobacteria bacterium]
MSAGQKGLVPEHTSGRSHDPADARHGVPTAARRSLGQLAPMPSQRSSTSHSPTPARQTIPAAAVSQRPSSALPAATLHARQSATPPPHADSQHTPSAQKPLMHSVAAAHAVPSAATRRWTRASSDPATSTPSALTRIPRALAAEPSMSSSAPNAPPAPATNQATPPVVAAATPAPERPTGPVSAMLGVIVVGGVANWPSASA